MKPRHIILTRFSVDYPNSFLKDYSLSKRAEWFKYRALIYKLGTLKSIRSNTVLPDEIICIFSPSDKTSYHSFLQEANITPIFATFESYQDVLSEYINSKYENVLISRIDSDDLIKNDYLEKIMQSYLETKNEIHVVVNAIVTDLINANIYRFDVSPFITIYHKNNYGNVSIFSYNHHEVDKFSPTPIKSTSWLQIIHNGNLSNRIFSKNVILSIKLKNLIKSILNHVFNAKFNIFISKVKLIHFEEVCFNDFLKSEDQADFIKLLKP
jgi:hypothetical protein